MNKPSLPSKLRFGNMQLRIMRLLWQQKLNARQITDLLSQEAPVAHSTVQTLLRQLEEKGAIAHEVDDRTFVFYPLVEEENTVRKATRDFVERLFSGNVSELMSHLLKNEKISSQELHQIRQLIEQKEKEKKS
ncbi:MAG: BlaI/MecI/CopY family transcriptional regulator [Verrucomicrobiota bacterium]